MRTLAILLACCSCCSVAWGAPPVVTLPKEVTGEPAAFIVVRAECDAPAVKFHAIDAGLNVFPSGLLSDPLATVVTSARPGRFRLLAYSGNADGPSEPVVVTVVVGNAPPQPDPPGPDPEPDPPKPPVVSGKRSALIIHETAETTPDLARMLTALRDGEQAKYLDSKSHKLAIFDDDDPVVTAAGWRPHLEGMKLPATFIMDAETKVLLHKGELPPSADAFIELIKKHGG